MGALRLGKRWWLFLRESHRHPFQKGRTSVAPSAVAVLSSLLLRRRPTSPHCLCALRGRAIRAYAVQSCAGCVALLQWEEQSLCCGQEVFSLSSDVFESSQNQLSCTVSHSTLPELYRRLAQRIGDNPAVMGTSSEFLCIQT